MFVDFNCIRTLWPEIILLIVAVWIYLGATIQNSRGFWTVFSIVVYGVVGAVIVRWEGAFWADNDAATTQFVVGPILVDYFGYALRLFVLLLGVLFTLGAARSTSGKLTGEYVASLMLLIVGLMLVSRANDLVVLFVSLELISIPTYLLIYLGRRDRATSEAAVKYFFLSLLASSLLLYGLSFLYGTTGTTTIFAGANQADVLATSAPATAGSTNGAQAGLVQIALLLIIAGLGFKMAVVPFHFYAPDVYQGTSNANAGLLAVAPKIAGAVAMIRLFTANQPSISDLVWQLTLMLALLTMTLGNVCALWQQNLRRLFAYSSIAHAGYILIGLSVGFASLGETTANGGIGAAVLYLSVYALGSFGVFAALASLSSERRELSDLDELAGLGRSKPLVAMAIAIFMFSLAGIPPLAGFWGKLGLFGSAVRTALNSDGNLSLWFAILAVGGAVNAAIAAAYYLRIIAVMYFRTRTATVVPSPRPAAATAMFACAILLVCVGVFPRAAVKATRLSGLSAVRLVHTRETQSDIGTLAAENARVSLPR